MNGEFEAMRGDLADLGIALYKTARDEHVGDIERFIRTLKECMRVICNTLPFKHVRPRVVIEMAKHAVECPTVLALAPSSLLGRQSISIGIPSTSSDSPNS